MPRRIPVAAMIFPRGPWGPRDERAAMTAYPKGMIAAINWMEKGPTLLSGSNPIMAIDRSAPGEAVQIAEERNPVPA